MVDRSYILAPQVVTVSFAVQPALNAIESLQELSETERLLGLGEWVLRTSAAMSEKQRQANLIVFNALSPIFRASRPDVTRFTDFMSYLDALENQDAHRLVPLLLEESISHAVLYPEKWSSGAPLPTVEQLLHDRATYVNFVRTLNKDECGTDADWNLAFDLISDPPAALAFVIDHLREMWNEYLGEEWTRILPMLQESVAAYQKVDFFDKTAYEVIRAVTGRDMTGKFDHKVARASHLAFVPSAHIGPYVGQFVFGDVLYLLFGARLPRGAQAVSSDLSRAELLIRLNALADDTRLRILELLTQHHELYAQDFIERLGLSQSSISRHLSQLAATGYITERRQEVAKVYSLNTDRVVDTLRALTNFLSRN